MKIAFFTDTYYPNIDGVVISLINLKKELIKNGHEVFIFAPKADKIKKEKGVYYFKSTKFKPYPDYNIALFPFISALKICKELDIDIIHSHGLATTGIAAIRTADKLHIPKIVTFHTMIPNGVHYLSSNKKIQELFEAISWRYLRWFLGHFDKVIVPSRTTEKILNKHKIEKTTIVSNGVDFKNFDNGDRAETRKKLRVSTKNVVLNVGRIVKEKRLEIIINNAADVINKVRNVVFVIVGDGPALKYYKELAKEKKVDEYFKFIGYVPRKELKHYYAAADLFAITSDFETQGLVVLEALYAGLPVVARKDTAPAEYIKNGVNGLIFTSPEDFAEKIEKGLKIKEELKEHTKEGLEQYSKENVAKRIEEIYEQLINEYKKNGRYKKNKRSNK